MDNEQIRTETHEAELPPALDGALRQRAAASSSQPWLELRVTAQVDSREQARQWLASHPRGLLGRPRLLLGSLSGTGLWSIVVALAVGTLSWWLAATLLEPAASAAGRSALLGLPLLTGLACGSLAALATQWPRLRRYYY